MAYTIPSDAHSVGNSGHTADHNNICDMLTLNTQYNVKNTAYSGGAAGNGVADDTAAIQAALTACRTSAYGGVVVIPPGIYLVSSILQIGSNTTLAGAGYDVTTFRMKSGSWAAVTQVSANITGISVLQTYNGTGASYVRVEGITFDGNETGITAIPSWANQESCGPLGLQGVTDVVVDSCQIINAIGYSLYLFGCTNFQVTGNRVLTGQVSAAQGWGTPTQQDGIHVAASQTGIIAGNVIDTGTSVGVGDDAIALQSWGTGTSASTNTTISGNVIRAAESGVDLAMSGGPVTNVAITGNTIWSAQADGINVRPFASGTSIVSNVSITGNVFNNVGLSGIYNGVTLADYTVEGFTSNPGWADIVIAGNSFNNFSSPTQFGIYAVNGTGLQINDNNFDNWNANAGIQIGDDYSGAALPVNNFQVSGNTINMSSASAGSSVFGILVSESYNGIISGNTIIGPGSGEANTWGVLILGTVDSPYGNIVQGNRISAWLYPCGEYNNGTAPNYNNFTGNLVRGCADPVQVTGANTITGGQQVIQTTTSTTGITGTGSQAITGLIASLDVGSYYVETTVPWIPTGTLASTTTFGFSAATLTLSALSLGGLITAGNTTAEAGTNALVTSTTLSDAMWTSPTHAATAGYGMARFWGTVTVGTAGTFQAVFANTMSADTVTMGAGATMLVRPLN